MDDFLTEYAEIARQRSLPPGTKIAGVPLSGANNVKLAQNRASDVRVDVREDADPVAAFTSETASAADKPSNFVWKTIAEWRPYARHGRRVLIGLLMVVVALGTFAGLQQIRTRWFAASPGRLTVTSIPSGAEVWIDGAARGATPLSVELAAGTHRVRLRGAGITRELSVASKANVEVVQVVELAAAAPTTGSLSITSEPAGIRLAIDGTDRGTTPALVTRLPPGQHTVTLAGKNGTVSRSVAVDAGASASLVIAMPLENVTRGGVGVITVASTIDVQLFEGETLVGTSRSARLFLPAGPHTIAIANEALGYRHVVTVDVKAGGTSKIAVPIPDGALSVNAQPWAEVFVDGRSLGETPIANYAVPIGSHELVLKHPQLGERRQVIVIGVGRTARIGVDLRK